MENTGDTPVGGRHPPGLVFRLAMADLRHEWILSLCLVLAIAAVLSPLLLLFGLKYGTIETLRFRLIQDPRNREIRPLVSTTFTREWFAQTGARPDVGFLVPLTRQIAATVSAKIKGGTVKADLDIVPTGAGDALVLENGAPIPRKGQCVLTRFAAEALGAKAGDRLVVTATRIKGVAYERGEVELEVVGVLSLRASAVKAMYVPLELLEAVEQYKDGQAVPDYGWTGTTAVAYPQYNGVLIVLPAPLPKVDEFQLCNNTGFTHIEQLDPNTQPARIGFRINPSKTVYLLFTEKKAAGEDSLANIRNRLRGRNATLIPWVMPIPARLVNAQGQTVTSLVLRALSVPAAAMGELDPSPRPPWNDQPRLPDRSLPLLPPEELSMSEGSFSLSVSNSEMDLTFPVALTAERAPAGGPAFVPAPLAGVLTLFAARSLRYDAATGDFVLFRRGYAGFRLYAKTIDEVDGLRRYFDDQGIPVHTAAEQIQTVIEMDRYLTLIFWLIAAVGIAGSAASLVASLYASVERKKRELSVLRLLGLSGPALYRFPIFQGALIAGGGYLVAWGFFRALSTTINTLFKAHLQAGEKFCTLPPEYVAGALAGTVLIACLAATVSVVRLARIEPAEALRDE